MHREISHTDDVFDQHSEVGLYLLTGLIGVLLGLDLYPLLANWLGGQGVSLPTFAREVFGFRYATIAAVVGGARVLTGSLDALFQGRLGADLALAIAAVAAILINEPLVAAEVIFIGLFGECLEAITFAKTQRAIGKLAELFPRRCWRLTADGQEERVFTNDVQVGDKVVVKPGAKVPVDGVVADGRSAVDTSSLTGESLPIDKGVGDEVLAGSVNQFGALTVEARKVQKETVAGQIIEMTGQALKDKAPIERHADRLAKYFLPAVLALAALTFGGYFLAYYSPEPAEGDPVTASAAVRMSVYPTLAVLVVACPCALILATPAAVIAALGRLAGTGVLIKGGAALERLGRVKTVAFDKTGTLTEGRLELGDVRPLSADENDLIATAAAAERPSEHPIARLMVAETGRRELPTAEADNFQAHPGAGVSADVAGRRVLVGTRRLLEEQGVGIDGRASAAIDELDLSGQTSLLVARDGVILGVIGARDRLRPEAAGVLTELREHGVDRLAVLTGDRTAVAAALATRLPPGVETHAELLPAQKAEWVESAGGDVAMVGDGVNDAPALARADVGLAIGGTGSDIAAEAGDVVLMGDPLKPLPLLLRLSRRTVEIIRQNIVIFAFAVNIVGVLVTAWLWPLFGSSPGWIESAPIAGVIYHQIGSLLVLLNSMRLLGFERGGAGSRWAKFTAGLQAIDGWMQRNLTVDELLHEAAHQWKRLLVGGVAVGVVVLLCTGITTVAADEVGVVRRFGRVAAVLEPGLSLRWPWPVETVTKLKPGEVRTVEIGFRPAAEADQPGPPVFRRDGAPGMTWASSHGGNVTPLTDESVMLTGDGNLIEVMATLRYRVSDPVQYLFGAGEPERVLRVATEAALRERVAGARFLDLLRADPSFQRGVLARLRATLPAGLGVTIDGLVLHDVHPPQEVVGAYHEVAKAEAGMRQAVNRAEAQATRTRGRAGQAAASIAGTARADSAKRVAEAEGEIGMFAARLRARRSLGWREELSLLGRHLLRAAGEDVTPESFAADFRRDRGRLIAEAAALHDFRMSWRALAEDLSNRDKILVDSDKVGGRRQLYLLDPETLRVPAANRRR